MRVLVACEFSGRVRDAFRARGHDAWSCDLLPCESEHWVDFHIQGDVMQHLRYCPTYRQYDLMIAFPPCTYLASSGAQYWAKRQKEQKRALSFVRALLKAPILKIALENPVGKISTVIRKPEQIINPWQFGEPYNKKTCLWLKNLPALTPTKTVKPTAAWCSSYHGGPRKDGTRKRNHLPSLHRNSKKRSITFQGIANAMAEQWG